MSVVSGWEFGMKRARRTGLFASTWEQLIEGARLERLGLDFACHSYAESLPPIHADPFGRMLVAQALHGGWTMESADATVRRHLVGSLW